MAGIGGRIHIATTQQLVLTPTMRRALDLLRMSGPEVASLVEDEAAANPCLMLVRPRRIPGSLPPAAPGTEPEAAGPGLYAHVLAWIEAHVSRPEDRQIALALAEALEPTGWLGESLTTIAAGLGLSEDQVSGVLMRVQRIEPAGLFARDLAECLRLQADAAGQLDPAMAATLARLPLLARGGAGAVARAAGLAPDAVAQAARTLRSFDPKPGTQFESGPVRVSVPDLLAGPGPRGGWLVRPNASALPEARARSVSGQDGGAFHEAETLASILARRSRLLTTIAQTAFDRQAGALAAGRAGLVPLTRREVAAATGLAASTVSRALNGVRVVTPHGTWPMAALFPAALPGGGSSAQVEAELRRLVANENRLAPLTDAELSARLTQAGLSTSRRTVTKYRERLGLPPATARKRRAGG